MRSEPLRSTSSGEEAKSLSLDSRSFEPIGMRGIAEAAWLPAQAHHAQANGFFTRAFDFESSELTLLWLKLTARFIHQAKKACSGRKQP